MNKNPTHLSHALRAPQIAMIAVGGSIGTGLLLGSGAAVQIAGPGIILSYALGALVAFVVTMALGEMASLHPAAGSFGVYADQYLNPWAGFVSRYGYWLAVVASVCGELLASATYMSFWFPHVPALVWMAVFSAALLYVNLGAVADFGRFEYWFAMIKVLVIGAFIVFGAAFLLGGKVQPHYTSDGGFLPRGAGGPFLALSLVLFNFLGVEMVAISSGEARTAAEIPRATYLTFGILAFVYVCASVVLVGIVPWNQVGVAQSPFVTVFSVAHVPAISHVMNFAVLTAALSGANASLYVAARMLYSLAQSGFAPANLADLSASGSPRKAIFVSASGIVVALLVQHFTPQNAFLYIIGASLCGGMMAWCVALASHISMHRRRTPEELAAIPMRAPGGALASAAALAAIVVVVICTWWVPQSRITAVSAGPYLVILTAFYFLAKRNSLRKETLR